MFHLLQCSNDQCKMRFPVPERAGISACPRCGASLARVELPYANPRLAVQALPAAGPRMVIVLDNLRSAFNVGSIMRTADGAGVEWAGLCGITPTPDNPKVGKTALSAQFATPWSYYPNGLDLTSSLKENALPIWALEDGPDAEPLTSVLGCLPSRLALVCGNELAGVDPGILEQCDRVVSLPMLGFKRSLNVAVAMGIAIYLIRFPTDT